MEDTAPYLASWIIMINLREWAHIHTNVRTHNITQHLGFMPIVSVHMKCDYSEMQIELQCKTILYELQTIKSRFIPRLTPHFTPFTPTFVIFVQQLPRDLKTLFNNVHSFLWAPRI